MHRQSLLLFLLIVTPAILLANLEDGYESCPCLDTGPLIKEVDFPVIESFMGTGQLAASDQQVLSTTYGVGCARHDLALSWCETYNATNCDPHNSGCSDGWCGRRWCYVAKDNCDIAHQHASLLKNPENVAYSYATCYDVDKWARPQLKPIRNRKYRIAILHTATGWTSTFHPSRSHFARDIDGWVGPTANFLRTAAENYNITLDTNFTPSELLKSHSLDFWGSHSNYDLCIFATQTGILDFCVGRFTITEKRATDTRFMHMLGTHIGLIVQQQPKNTFAANVAGTFQSLQGGVWLLVLFAVIPVFGLMTLYHEYDQNGSIFPRKEAYVVRDPNDGDKESLQYQVVPIAQYLWRSLFSSYLALANGGLGQTMVTASGKVHLLGINFFLFMFTSIFVANLAAILQNNLANTNVADFAGAVQNGYRFCITRQRYDLMRSHYPNISPSSFVRDPVDKKIGFINSPNSNLTEMHLRVLEQIHVDRATVEDNQNLAVEDKQFCHAGLTLTEELEGEHHRGLQCDLVSVGPAVVPASLGFPIFSQVSEFVLAWLNEQKNTGLLEQEITAAQAQLTSQCPVVNSNQQSLSMKQLSGVWVLWFGFAFLGLIHTIFIKPLHLRYKRRHPHKKYIEKFYKYDQYGGPIPAYEEIPASELTETIQDVEYPVGEANAPMSNVNVVRHAESGLTCDSSVKSVFVAKAIDENKPFSDR